MASIYSVGMHHMSQYVKTFEEHIRRRAYSSSTCIPTRVVERWREERPTSA